jgi:hypothetical protein
MWPMPSPTVPALDPKNEPQLASVGLGWALRRTALGVLILVVAVGAVAWLFNAGIEPDGATSEPASRGEYALPQN